MERFYGLETANALNAGSLAVVAPWKVSLPIFICYVIFIIKACSTAKKEARSEIRNLEAQS